MHDVLTSDTFKRNVVKIVLIGHMYTLIGYGDAGMHHGTLIYNNYSPGVFSSSYVQAKLVEVSFLVQYIYIYIYTHTHTHTYTHIYIYTYIHQYIWGD